MSAVSGRILKQVIPLARAIKALETLDHTGWFKRAQVRLLLAAYRHGCGPS